MEIGTSVFNLLFGTGTIVAEESDKVIVAFISGAVVPILKIDLEIKEDKDLIYDKAYQIGEEAGYENNPYTKFTSQWVRWKAGFNSGVMSTKKTAI